MTAVENSETVRLRVIAGRERQLARSGKVNALMNTLQVRECCSLNSCDARWLEEVLQQLGLSIRAWQRILKVARTLADMESCEAIGRRHLQEAVGYRAMERLIQRLQR